MNDGFSSFVYWCLSVQWCVLNAKGNDMEESGKVEADMSDSVKAYEQCVLMESFSKTDDIEKDMRTIIESARHTAYTAVNTILLQRNWLLGYRISEEVLSGGDRAEYGANIIARLSKALTAEYGKGFTKTNLYHFYSSTKNILIFSTQ